MTETTIQTLIQYIASPLAVAAFGYIIHILKDQRKGDKAASSGIMLLLRRELYDMHKKFVLRDDKFTRDDYSNVVEVYECYKALGGNSTADKLYEELDDLEIMEG